MRSEPFIYLAPLQGVTNSIYQKAHYQQIKGIDVYCNPFIKVQLQRPKHKKSKLPLESAGRGYEMLPQLISNNSREFIQFDQDIKALGYYEFNWNLGCPFKTVVRKKRGAGLLPYPGLVKQILDEVMDKLQCRLSVKCRLGLEDKKELKALMPIFNQYPVKEIIIHPRLGKQQYLGEVDIQAFQECLSLSQHDVVYNGDIFNRERYAELKALFPQVIKWMIGRGALANPFLPAQLKGIQYSYEEKLKQVTALHQAVAEGYEAVLQGPAHFLHKMKEFWFFQSRLFETGEQFFNRLKKTKNRDAYDMTVNQLLASTPEIKENLVLRSEEI